MTRETSVAVFMMYKRIICDLFEMYTQWTDDSEAFRMLFIGLFSNRM